MTISPLNDLVLDVARAASPEAIDAARTRLSAIAAGRGAAQTFDAQAASVTDEAARPERWRAGGATLPDQAEAFRKFEAMVLQTFLQSMLPQDTESVYGEGLAGEMWQSLMAEQLANVMAQRGGIGIADRILKGYYTEGDTKMPLSGVSADPDLPARQEQEALSTALIQEIQRKIAQNLDQDRSVRPAGAGAL